MNNEQQQQQSAITTAIDEEEDKSALEQQEEHERRYNFRFEEEGGTELRSFPDTSTRPFVQKTPKE